jgi:SAM-dependent methyltransferase
LWDIYEKISLGYHHWRPKSWSISRIVVKGRYAADLGSGPCQNGIYLAKARKYNYVICIDLSSNMLKVGMDHLIKNYTAVPVDFIQADFRYAPLRFDAFDAEIAIASFHHLPPNDLLQAIQRIKESLKRLGLLVVTTWSPWQARFIFNILLNIFKKLFLRRQYIREFYVPWRRGVTTYFRYYYLYTLSELKNFLEVNGFKVISMGYYTPKKKKRSENLYVIAVKTNT